MKKSTLRSLIRKCLMEMTDVQTIPPAPMSKTTPKESSGGLEYVEYVKDMNNEVPFTIGGKKYEYVMAKYPTGKIDIAVYAFAGDVVYSYNSFRKMYNINESLAEKKRLSAVSFRLNKQQKDPRPLRESATEPFNNKAISGTVSSDGIDYNYQATVSGNIMGAHEPHGEDTYEIDEDGLQIEIQSIDPEPVDSLTTKVDELIYDDIHGSNLWDLVSEESSTGSVGAVDRVPENESHSRASSKSMYPTKKDGSSITVEKDGDEFVVVRQPSGMILYRSRDEKKAWEIKKTFDGIGFANESAPSYYVTPTKTGVPKLPNYRGKGWG